jgi:hypothetical protein
VAGEGRAAAGGGAARDGAPEKEGAAAEGCGGGAERAGAPAGACGRSRGVRGAPPPPPPPPPPPGNCARAALYALLNTSRALGEGAYAIKAMCCPTATGFTLDNAARGKEAGA